MQVNILEAKNQLSRLIKHAQEGDEVIIANRGEPVARLVATGGLKEGAPKPGSAVQWLDWLDRHPLPAHRRRSHAEIQATINEERAAWE